MENVLYTAVQIGHNFGAAAVVGSPIAGWWLERRNLETHRLAILAFIGWFIQGASGAGIAATSYFLKGALPEATGIAFAALLVKIISTVLGCAGTALIWRKKKSWRIATKILLWKSLVLISRVALAAAAFLRWYL